MTTLGHLLIVVLWMGGSLGALLGLTWLRWQRDKRRAPEYWKRQPP